jgi:hypothetical protein
MRQGRSGGLCSGPCGVPVTLLQVIAVTLLAEHSSSGRRLAAGRGHAVPCSRCLLVVLSVGGCSSSTRVGHCGSCCVAYVTFIWSKTPQVVQLWDRIQGPGCAASRPCKCSSLRCLVSSHLVRTHG